MVLGLRTAIASKHIVWGSQGPDTYEGVRVEDSNAHIHFQAYGLRIERLLYMLTKMGFDDHEAQIHLKTYNSGPQSIYTYKNLGVEERRQREQRRAEERGGEERQGEERKGWVQCAGRSFDDLESSHSEEREEERTRWEKERGG